jgi:hypothetical protein
MSTNRMTSITLKLTPEEAELLTSLISDQLFRREFIDPKMPGFKSNVTEITLGKALMARLRAIVDPDRAQKTQSARITR